MSQQALLHLTEPQELIAVINELNHVLSIILGNDKSGNWGEVCVPTSQGMVALEMKVGVIPRGGVGVTVHIAGNLQFDEENVVVLHTDAYDAKDRFMGYRGTTLMALETAGHYNVSEYYAGAERFVANFLLSGHDEDDDEE